MPTQSKETDKTNYFSRLLTLETAYRVYNGAIGLSVLAQYFLSEGGDRKPNEYLLDGYLHLAEAILPNRFFNLPLTALNALRANQAFFSLIDWMPSTIPSFANGIDVFNHGINILWHRHQYEERKKMQAEQRMQEEEVEGTEMVCFPDDQGAVFRAKMD